MINSFTSQLSGREGRGKKLRKAKHQERRSIADEEEEEEEEELDEAVQSDSTDPLIDNSPENSPRRRSRTTFPQSSSRSRQFSGNVGEESPYEEEEVEEDNYDEDDDGLQEVLDAVPELRSCRLVGDECMSGYHHLILHFGVLLRKCGFFRLTCVYLIRRPIHFVRFIF